MDSSTQPSSFTTKAPVRRSKILAALDAEAANFASSFLPSNGITSTKSSSVMGQLFSQSAAEQQEPKAAAFPSEPSSKGKRKVTALQIQRASSDIENNPAAAEQHIPNSSADTTKAKPNAPPKSQPCLPLYSFKQYRPAPAVVYTRHEEEANDLVQGMKGPLGFDLEWVVTFRRGKPPTERPTALVQLSDARMILLVQISAMKKFPQKLKQVIEDKDRIKLGANIRNDGQKLFRDFGLLPAGLVELGALARLADPTFSKDYQRSIVALAKVVQRYTHKTLDKGKVRTSNWEATLSQTQITYAANDAHCAFTVYNILMSIAGESASELDWNACAADLAKEYREKTAANAITDANIARAGSSQATQATAEDKESEEDISTPAPTPTSTQSQLSRISSAGWNPFARQPSSSSAGSSQMTGGTRPSQEQREPPRPQHLRAYNLWHRQDMPLVDICATLRTKEHPLAESTVISYVVGALQADSTLPFSMERLKAFVQLEAWSWRRHRDWILEKDGYKKA